MQNNILKPLSDDAKANPRATSVRIKSLSSTRAQSQRRHDLRIGRQPSYVDGDRAHLNRVLQTLRSIPQIHRENEQLRSQRGCERKMKSNAVAVVAGIITFEHEAQKMFLALTDEQQDAAYCELAHRIAERLETQLESLVSHGDETAPHAHFMLRGYTYDGLPVSSLATYNVTAALQDIAAEVMQAYCSDIERGHKKWERIASGADYVDTIHRSVKQLHEDLPCEIEERQAELANLVDQIAVKEASLAKTHEHLRKAELRRDKTARQLKRIKTYRKRSAVKAEELRALEEASLRTASDLVAMENALVARNHESDKRDAEQKIAQEAIENRLLEIEVDAYIAGLEADKKAEDAKQARLIEEAAADAARAETVRLRDEQAAAHAKAVECMDIAKAAAAQRLESEAAMDQHKAAMAEDRQQLSRDQDALKFGVAAVTSVVKELAAGTLRREVNGKLRMDNPQALQRAPEWVRKELAPLIYKVVDLRAQLVDRVRHIADKLSVLSTFLSRDDLTDEARRTGADLQADAEGLDIDDLL